MYNDSTNSYDLRARETEDSGQDNGGVCLSSSDISVVENPEIAEPKLHANSDPQNEPQQPAKSLLDIFDQATEQNTKLVNGKRAAMIERIYSAYPRKVGKLDALKAIGKAIDAHDPESVLSATEAYARSVARWPKDRRKYIPHPASWINQGRFLDDQAEWGEGRSKLEQEAIEDSEHYF
jgi:hypothetical protein